MTDRYLWLEDITGAEALKWVTAQNERAESALAATESFARTKQAILDVLDSEDKIPGVVKAGDHLYNFWRDANHERGLWRRTTMASYCTATPEWEVLLDLDAVAAQEGVEWVWHGAQLLRTGALAFTRALITLSRGGSDADSTREFDVTTGRFLTAQEGGFERGEAKGSMTWIDSDTVFVQNADDGEPTTSGYPSRSRRLRRGQSITEGDVVFSGEHTDLLVSAHHDRTPGFERDWVTRALTFYTSEQYLLDPRHGAVKLDLPASAEAGCYREWLLVELRDEWVIEQTAHSGGSLLAIPLAAFLAGARNFTPVFRPTSTTALVGATWTRHHLVLNVLDDVKNRLEVLTPPVVLENGMVDGEWHRQPFPAAPPLGTVAVTAVDRDDPEFADTLWMTATDYLTPTTLSLVTLDVSGVVTASEAVKSAPSFFDASGLESHQYFATSTDGTKVPYAVVHRADLPTNGSTPTLLYGYGGFEISLTPNYSPGLGRAWLERGGVYVVAGIRGGGEYGPRWHQAALRENRHRAYEDMAAVARDIINRGLTSPEHLGVQGGSNGGLMAGNMLTQYPELFGAVVIQVPLLDMQRYHLLLAGASWMAEYGDPDNEDDWRFLQTFSPYHLMQPNRTYPPVLLTTSTRDDRVHPGHARKMAALMTEYGHDVTSYENIEGGHGGAATNAQAAHMSALAYEFLWQRLAKDM